MSSGSETGPLDPVLLDPTVVIGTGLLGASVGAALTRAGIEVHLSDAVVHHARVAATLGAGTTAPVDPGTVRLVVVATPPRTLAGIIGRALDRYPRAVVTDVGSVKGSVLRELRGGGRDLSRYLGSHPMAGSQHSGPAAASADLFVDRTWAITPHEHVAEGTAATVRALIEVCGARPVVLQPDDHDAAVAQVSHLPHLMSVLMADHLVDLPARHLDLAGQGLRDVTRIAGSDPDLWDQIIDANTAALRPELEAVHERLGALIVALETGEDDVRPFLERGRSGTRRIPGKHGAPATEYARLVIEIPDARGALARLFQDIAGAGVNIEDIAIQHDPARQVGYLEVAVDPDRAVEVAEAMKDAGWRLHG